MLLNAITGLNLKDFSNMFLIKNGSVRCDKRLFELIAIVPDNLVDQFNS